MNIEPIKQQQKEPEPTINIPSRMHTNRNKPKPKQQKEKCAFKQETKKEELLPEFADVFRSMESEFIIKFE